MDHGDRRSGAAARPWRGGVAAGGGGGPPPPKVYRVEPRDFRELVQRLTGAGTPAAAPGTAHHRATLTPAMVADSRRAQAAAAVPVPVPVPGAGAAEQFDYAAWFSAPLLSPAYGAPGFSGGHGSSGPLL